MKIFSCLFLGFDWQQRSQLPPNYCGVEERKGNVLKRLQLLSKRGNVAEGNDKILKVLDTAGSIGQVGSLASEEDQLLMEKVAEDVFSLSESNPARIPLAGEHKLVYSAAKGGSSGRIFGNVVGKVSQLFEDDEIFYNQVKIGPLQISLRAKREIKNDSTIKVSFLDTSFNLFGRTLKKADIKGGGVWKVKFVGKVEDDNGNKKLVRIMETPSLFILEQDL